jgi:uncharacterized protein YggE
MKFFKIITFLSLLFVSFCSYSQTKSTDAKEPKLAVSGKTESDTKNNLNDKNLNKSKLLISEKSSDVNKNSKTRLLPFLSNTDKKENE